MLCKLVILGEEGVGKSATVIQLVQNHFVVDYDPTIENSYRKQLLVDEEYGLVEILDTAGEEQHAYLRRSYVMNNDVVLFMYSITNRKSFDKIGEFYHELLNARDDTVPMALVGNKCDLKMERQVSTEEGEELANTLNCCCFYESSAKYKINLESVFIDLLREFRKVYGTANAHK